MGTKWFNDDGLVVRFGARSTSDAADVPAQTSTAGKTQEITLRIADMTDLGTDATADSGAYTAGEFVNSAFIPANATVQQVTIKTLTAVTSGGAADLLLGAYTISTSTGLLVAVDADGFAAAGDSALADFSAAGESIILGKAAGAALIGKVTVGSSPVVIAATYVTAVYTAGAIEVIVEYTLA